MESEILKKKVTAFYSFLEVDKDAFKVNNVDNENNVISQIIDLFRKDHAIFNKFLYKTIDLKIAHSLQVLYEIKNLRKDDPIKKILPFGQLTARTKQLSIATELSFPRPVLSKSSLLFQLILLLFPALTFIFFMLYNFEFIIVLHGLLKFSVLIFLITIPFVVVYSLFPKYFQPNEFIGIKTYGDLIDGMVLMSRQSYIEDDYSRTKEEIQDLLRTFS